ncbi:MAG: hypothetical protein ACREQJ_10945 [Candidatus Binatia bacterium]
MSQERKRVLVTRSLHEAPDDRVVTDLHRELGYVALYGPEGPYQLPRDRAYEGRFLLFLEDHELSVYQDFENEVFAIRPAGGSPCACGYEDRESAWFRIETHEPGCFQAEHEALRERYGTLFDVPETALKELCLKHGRPWNDGYASAVHCTCDFDERWRRWKASNDHDLDCPVVRPNFEYKPSGFWIRWDEHPILGASISRALDRTQFKAVVAHCERSLHGTNGGEAAKEPAPVVPIVGEDEERLFLRIALAEHRASLEGLVAILDSKELQSAELVAWLNGYQCPESVTDDNQEKIRIARALLTTSRERGTLEALRNVQRWLESLGDAGRSPRAQLQALLGRPDSSHGRRS